MTSLNEKANEAGGPEIVTTSDLPSAQPGRIASPELVDCDDLTAEGQFPQFGEFLEMRREDGETVYWECSSTLAEIVVEEVERAEESELTGTRLAVDYVAKAPDGTWRFTLDVDPSETLVDSTDD